MLVVAVAKLVPPAGEPSQRLCRARVVKQGLGGAPEVAGGVKEIQDWDELRVRFSLPASQGKPLKPLVSGAF